MKNQRRLASMFTLRTGRTTARLPAMPDPSKQCPWFRPKVIQEWWR